MRLTTRRPVRSGGDAAPLQAGGRTSKSMDRLPVEVTVNDSAQHRFTTAVTATLTATPCSTKYARAAETALTRRWRPPADDQRAP
jgi:hypothetical protein